MNGEDMTKAISFPKTKSSLHSLESAVCGFISSIVMLRETTNPNIEIAR